MEGGENVETNVRESSPLQELQQQETSLLALLKVLLSGRTLPHLVLIFLLSSALFWAASNGGESFAAIGFLSMAGGYLLTGVFSGFAMVRRWIQLPQEHASEDIGRVKQLVFSFRICLFPIAMAVVAFGVLISLVGEQGVLGDQTASLQFVLGSCFVVWAVVQGRAFSRWLASVSASRLPDQADRMEGPLRRSGVSTMLLVVALATGVLALVTFIKDGTVSVPDLLVDNLLFYGALVGLFALAWRRSNGAMLAASNRSDFHAFSTRWMLLTQLLITWHLLTVWRHQAMTPSDELRLIEELLLMMFTVVMAIWGLTSKSYRSSMQMIHSHNALPVGLAFGYAYAGSVAMLTAALDNVENVMILGHGVVILTILWLQPRIIFATMGDAATSERIREVVESVVPAPEPSAERHDDIVAASEGSESSSAEAEVVSETAGESPADVSESIGEQVAWSEPEVLATDVDWDDELELLD
ncbi:MAG TPA: hypothetical protein D7I11_00800 [Candidatus Poseidoniales archaeon]|nr:MAG TPA: hypothetical protein D7I11_00800 [Candidatus Poseidoniales archaeon]HII26934.1 hypothetical protein [Poseidonia sp.]